MEVNPVLCVLCSLLIGISLGFECTEDDSPYYPHEKDCGKFYECKHGVKIENECPVGTHWSKTTNSCELPAVAKCNNQPSNVESTGNENENENIQAPVGMCLNGKEKDIIALENDKTRFIKCVAGVDSTIGCPKSFTFNKKIKTCDFKLNLNCLNKISILSVCTESEDYSLHPDPTSCKKYIQCLDGKPVGKRCPGSESFKKELQLCTSEELVDCQVINTDESNCPSADDIFTATNMSYPNDCTKYYITINGEAYPAKCPLGKHWSSQLNHCELPEIAKCDSRYSSVKLVKQPGEPIPHENCPADENTDNHKHLPYPDDCTKFYKCLNGYAYPIDCPPGLHWSVELNRCEWPEVANCEKSNEIDRPKLSSPDLSINLSRPILSYPNPDDNINNSENKCRSTYEGYISDSNDCTKYIKCLSGIDVSLTCPTELHWNAVLNMCDYPENAMCDKSKTLAIDSDGIANDYCPSIDDPNNPKYLPYTEDCSLYFVCRKGKAYIKICPPEAEWNEQENKCDFPEIAKCNHPKGSLTINSMIEPKPNPLCSVKIGRKKHFAINFKHENDCSMFYICQNGFAYPKNCPPGLLWNETWKRCYYAEVTLCKTGNNVKKRLAFSRAQRSLFRQKFISDPNYNMDTSHHIAAVQEPMFKEQHLFAPYHRIFQTRPKTQWPDTPNMEENLNNRPFKYNNKHFDRNVMLAESLPPLPPGPSSIHRPSFPNSLQLPSRPYIPSNHKLPNGPNFDNRTPFEIPDDRDTDFQNKDWNHAISSIHRQSLPDEFPTSPNLSPIPAIPTSLHKFQNGPNFQNNIPDDRDLNFKNKDRNSGPSSIHRPSFPNELLSSPNLPSRPADPSIPKIPNGPNLNNRIPFDSPDKPDSDFHKKNKGEARDVLVPRLPSLPPSPPKLPAKKISSSEKLSDQPSVPDIPARKPISPDTDASSNKEENIDKDIKNKVDKDWNSNGDKDIQWPSPPSSSSDEKPPSSVELPEQPSVPDVPVRKPISPVKDPSSDENENTDKDNQYEENIISAIKNPIGDPGKKKIPDDGSGSTNPDESTTTDKKKNPNDGSDCTTTAQPTITDQPTTTTEVPTKPDPQPDRTEEHPESIVFTNPFDV